MVRVNDIPVPTAPFDGHPRPGWMSGRLVVALERLPQAAYVWDDPDPDVVWAPDTGDVLTEPFDNLAAWTVGGGAPTIVTGRTGTAATATGTTDRLDYNIPAAGQFDTVVAGFAWQRSGAATAVRSICELYSDNGVGLHNKLTFQPTTNTLAFTRGVSPIASAVIPLAAGTWFYIELRARLHDTAGSVTVRVNGVDVINVAGLDTRNGGTKAVYDQLRLLCGTSAAVALWDDLYLSTGPLSVFKGDPTTSTPADVLVWDAPFVGSGYTDVWCDLVELTIRSGFPDQWENYLTGQARLVVRDPGDGRYTTRTADGRLVYYAPGRRLAVYWLDPAGVGWWLFHGAIATWRQPRLDGTVEIEAFACTGDLAQPVGRVWTAGTATDYSGTRIAAIGAVAGFTGRQGGDSGDVQLSVPAAGSDLPLDAMRRAAASDGGIVYADADDTLLYRDRRWRNGRPDQTDIPTFTDNVCDAGPDVVVGWDPVAADSDLRLAGLVRLSNDATPPLVAAANGSDYVNARLIYTHQYPDLWKVQADGDLLAAHEADVRSDARLAVGSLDVHLHDYRWDYWDAVVKRRLGDRVRWLHQDTYTDPPSVDLYDLELVLTGLGHTVTPESWTVELGSAPAVAYTAVEAWDVTALFWDDESALAVWR